MTLDSLAPVEFGKNTAQALRDGRLAFAEQGGLAAVDPAAASGVSVAPRFNSPNYRPVTGPCALDQLDAAGTGERIAATVQVLGITEDRSASETVHFKSDRIGRYFQVTR